MEYAQLNEALTEAIQITTHGNVEWDANNFCSAKALTRDGKADQFRVVPLTVTAPPTFDDATHRVFRDGCELVGDQWQYKWTVVALTAGELEAARIASIPQSVSPRQIRQALTTAGLRAAVETAIAGGSQDLKDWYEFSTAFERTHPAVIAMATSLGVSDVGLDDLFILAGSLT